MKRTIQVALLLASLVVIGGCAPPKGQKTPAAAIEKMMRARMVNDQESLRECLAGTSESVAAMCATAEANAEMRKMIIAFRQKFGEKEYAKASIALRGADRFPTDVEIQEILESITVEISEKGSGRMKVSKAVARSPKLTLPITLRKIYGAWCVETSSLAPPEENFENRRQLMTRLKNYAVRIQAEIEKPLARTDDVTKKMDDGMRRVLDGTVEN